MTKSWFKAPSEAVKRSFVTISFGNYLSLRFQFVFVEDEFPSLYKGNGEPGFVACDNYIYQPMTITLTD